MKILLLSAYDALSHVYWREGLYAAFPDVAWTTLSLPPRYFPWRIRGNSMSWYREPVLRDRYDLCIATSMVDLATLRGLVPELARLPTLLYFHENQFAYPLSDRVSQQQQVGPQFVQIYSAMAADALCFNSEYNRTSFFSGLAALLKKMPDEVPAGVCDALKSRAQVVPVGLQSIAVNLQEKTPTSLVWNHRWEYDKGPERLLAFVQALPEQLSLTLHVLGQSFRSVPPAFAELRALLEARGWLGQWGYVKAREDYLNVLAQSQYVISTSDHDFQGLAILEAVQCGCIPILPKRLAYPEFFTEPYLYPCSDSVETEAQCMAAKVAALLGNPELAVPALNTLSLDAVRRAYQDIFSRLLG